MDNLVGSSSMQQHQRHNGSWVLQLVQEIVRHQCRNSEALILSTEKLFISQGNITGKLVQIKNAKDSISQGSITHGMPNSKKEYYSLEIGEPYPLLLEMPV